MNNLFFLIFNLKQSNKKSHKNNEMTHCQNPGQSASTHTICSIYTDSVIFALSNIKSQSKRLQKNSALYG